MRRMSPAAKRRLARGTVRDNIITSIGEAKPQYREGSLPCCVRPRYNTLTESEGLDAESN
jgi:hypothetical protein